MGRKPKYSKEVKVKVCEDYQKGNGSFVSIKKIYLYKRKVNLNFYRIILVEILEIKFIYNE